MQDAVWRFVHQKQVLMDLTFKFCSAPALLMILMAFNESGKGIPVTLFVFTARETAKAAHADYNKPLIRRLLEIFKDKIGINESGERLTFTVANTNNDARERKALSTVFPGVQLSSVSFTQLKLGGMD